MAHVQLADNLFEIDNLVRIESGPLLKTAVATEALLSNAATADHYQTGANDALGRPITLGAEMAYLDWLGVWGWYVYRWEPAPTELIAAYGLAEDAHHWAEKGVKATRDEAEIFAATLL